MRTKDLLQTTIVILVFIAGAHAQNVNIPDVNFKAALVNNASININMDAEIQITEANVYSGSINVSGWGISDLTGIEAFIALDSLSCAVNPLMSLDVSNNTLLTYLNCAGGCQNQDGDPWGTPFGLLTSLDVSNNTLLNYLDCSNNILNLGLNLTGATSLIYLDCSGHFQIGLGNIGNPPPWFQLGSLSNLDISSNTALETLNCSLNNLTNLDVSNNTLLNYLDCSNNNLTTLVVMGASELTYINCSNQLGSFANNVLSNLDVSTHTALTALYCEFNQLTNLNVKNGNNMNMWNFNMNMWNFGAFGNPNLSCIEVDSAAWSTANWSNNIDPTAYFSENCNGVGILDNNESTVLQVNPNPTTDIIHLSELGNIALSDLTGKLLLKQKNTNQMDISSLPTGIYFLRVGENKQQTFKIIKE